MDKLRGLGDSTEAVWNFQGESQRLREEKMKAIKTLQMGSKANKLSSWKSSPSSSQSPGLNFTDYASYRWKDTFDISITDKTINLESFHKASNPIQFEPSEITGRSTSCNVVDIQNAVEAVSVEQILASSCSEEVRNMRQSLCSKDIESLPRTADVSKSSSIRDSLLSASSAAAAVALPSSFSGLRRTNESGFVGESFEPVENILSKLSADEKEWEKEYADIPAANNDKKTKNQQNTTGSDFSRCSVPEPEMSMGTYFQTRSADLKNIISNPLSPKKHKPVALINDSDLVPERDLCSKSPNSDEKKSEKISTNAIENRNDENKNQSYLLSLSAIANALNEIDLNATGTSVVNRLLGIKSYVNQPCEQQMKNNDRTYSMNPKQILKQSEVEQNICQQIMENKENLDPKIKKPIELSDTASFTESLFDCSNFRQFNRENAQKIPHKSGNVIPAQEVDVVKSHHENQQHIPKAGKSRKRPHSALQDNSKSVNNKNVDHLENFLKDCNHVSPIKVMISENSILRSPHNCSTLNDNRKAFDASHSNFKRNMNFEPQVQKNYLTIDQAARAPSNTSSPSPNSSSKSSAICLHGYASSTSKSPLSSLDSTMIDDQKLAINVCSSPEYGKYSLPSNGLGSRMPSTSNLSTKSGNSEYSHQDGRLPLKATCVNLSWGSVKLRKTVQKSIQIKNTSNKRLVIRTEIRGPGFQIVNLEQGNLLLFHSQECRTITLSFCPTVIGVAVGEIKFCPTVDCPCEKQVIGLYGYGGHASIIPKGILKGPVGSPFLTMGELRQLSHPLTKYFSVYNRGPLTGFIVITVDSIGLDIPRLCDSIEINPKKILIYPQSEIKITVTFRPRRDDVKKIMKKISSVITLANIRIICGDEPTRHRIRKLIKTMSEKDKLKISTGALENVWRKFPGECVSNLDELKEESEAVLELIETLRTHEIALTLNHMQSLDETIETTLVYPEGDETVMFRTIISNHASDKDNNETLQSMKTCHDDILEMWSITPHILEIDPMNKKKAIFTVSNKFCKSYHFQIDTNFMGLFEIQPKVGTFYPGKNLDVTVSIFGPSSLPTQDVFITVYIENAKLSIPVKISKDNYPLWLR